MGAITALRPERIGHGTRAAEDPALVGHLAATRLPVEACPLSNVATGVVGSLEEHPIRRLRDAGVLVTVNTDDPTMFNNSLAEEYALLHGRLGFSADEVRGLLLDAVTASWMPAPRKQQMADAFRRDPAWSAGYSSSRRRQRAERDAGRRSIPFKTGRRPLLPCRGLVPATERAEMRRMA